MLRFAQVNVPPKGKSLPTVAHDNARQNNLTEASGATLANEVIGQARVSCEVYADADTFLQIACKS